MTRSSETVTGFTTAARRFARRTLSRRAPVAVVFVALAAVIGIAVWRIVAPVAHDEPSAPAANATQVALSAEARALAGMAVEPARTVRRDNVFAATAVLAIDETRTARIGSMVEGTVIATFKEVGDRVPARAVLGAIHSPVVHEAWAGYRKAVAERRRMTTELEYARTAEARARRLFDAKAISAQEVERAEANRSAAEQQLVQAQTEVRRAEEELEHLGITNGEDPSGESGEQIPARTPIAGVVLERLVTTGTAITPGAPLYVVSDLSSLWALAEVDETHLAHVRVGQPAEVRVSAYRDEGFPAKVTFVGDTVNPKTRRVTVRCLVPNSAGRLKPEMFATVMLGTGEPRPALVVPSTAVHDVGGRTVVFVEGQSRAFEPRAVIAGAEADGAVEITQGLSPGERVATAGSFLLKSELLKGAASPD